MNPNRGWQSQVQTEFAIPIYKQFWDQCEVVENDTNGATEESAKVLDFGDVDKIIRVSGKHIHLAQRFRKPWGPDNRNDPDFTLRYSRPTSNHTIEYERLMGAYEDPAAAYPRRYAFGRVYPDHAKGLYELYILDTDVLIESIQTGALPEHGPKRVGEGQEMMWYSLDDIRAVGGIVKEWHEETTGQATLSNFDQLSR